MEPILIFLKLPPEEIVTIKFIIESYDSLGIIRTLNAEKGEIVVLAPFDSAKTLNELLDSLVPSLKLRIIPPPDDVNKDWLVSEYYQSLA